MVNENSEPDLEPQFANLNPRAPGRRKLLGKLLSLAGLGVVGALLSQEKAGILPAARAADGAPLTIGVPNFGSTPGMATNLTADVPGGRAFFVSNVTPNLGANSAFEANADGNANSGVVALRGFTFTQGAIGVKGEASNTLGGTGVYGSSIGGTGVYGTDSATSGLAFGVQGISASSHGEGVFGWATAASGDAVGVRGASTAAGGAGVFAQAGNDATTPLVAQGNSATQSANLQEWRNSSGAALSVVDKNGNLGIGTSTPTVKLDVAGDAHATDFVATSDMRFKEEVVPIDGALDKVLRLQGVYFKWNDQYRRVLKRTNTKARQVGLIAQQVREVMPEVVSEWGDERSEAYLGVDSSRLVAVTIEAMKEQQNQIQRLRERILKLEDHLKRFPSS